MRKGGPNDPVAQSIRNEQNLDAMPSKVEQEEERRKFLEERGCKFCGEDDPDKLNATGFDVHHCPYQPHRFERIVYCDSCGFDAEEYRQEIRESKVKEDHVAMVVYNCHSFELVERPDPPTTEAMVQVGYDENDDPTYEKQEIELPEKPTLKAPIECPACEAEVKEVNYFD